jgi:hypothetical protein
MTRDKIRHEVLLSVPLSKRIVSIAMARKCSKSELLADLIDSSINRRWADQPDERMFASLDRIRRVTTRTNYETTLISYCLSRFIRHQLIYAAALPPPGDHARAIGEKRYQQFLDTVARLVARDRFKDDQEFKEEKPPHSSEKPADPPHP